MSEGKLGFGSSLAANPRIGSWRTPASTRGRNAYPSPFLDVAQNYMPNNVSDLFDQCEYYAIAHPLISAIIYKLSVYGITDFIYGPGNHGLEEKYKEIFEETLNLRQFLVDVLLDYHAYGNAFVTVSFPFKKFLKGKSCGHSVAIQRANYRYQNYQFRLKCPICGMEQDAIAYDVPQKSITGIRLIRWYPKYVRIERAGITDDSVYLYTIPTSLKNDLMLNKPHLVQNTPQIFLEALRRNRPLVFNPNEIFHLKRSSVSRENSSWGLPLLLSVLKDAFYLQILRKGQEAIALSHINPMRFLFPQATAGVEDPYGLLNMSDWQSGVRNEVKKHQDDPGYISTMPVPIGYQSIGGDAKALLLHQEIRVWNENICAGLGIPSELVYGGLSYSGSNVSLRMLENTFLRTREQMLKLVRWIRDQVISGLNIDKINMKFKDFKMADDLQRAAFDYQLAGANWISKRTFLHSRDYEYDAEKAAILDEKDDTTALMKMQQLAQAEAQGEASIVTAQFQAQAQQVMQALMPQQPDPNQPGGQPGQADAQSSAQSPMNAQTMQASAAGANQDKQMQAAQIVGLLKNMPSYQKYQYLEDLQSKDPDLHWLVFTQLNAPPESAMAPLPEQKPPRRGPESASI